MIRQLRGKRGRDPAALTTVRRMKTNRFALAALSASLVVAAVGLSPPRIAHADAAANEGLGTWEGSGLTTDVDGTTAAPFTVAITRSTLAGGGVRADGKIHTSDGKDIAFWQETVQRGGGKFRVTSNLGSGGGSCFANGMCQSLEQRADGHAFASTIAKDGPDKVRVLVTELKDGNAVRFYAQTLVKKL
jgi:hypothetical protein